MYASGPRVNYLYIVDKRKSVEVQMHKKNVFKRCLSPSQTKALGHSVLSFVS